ncbi:MAG TPA: hypothetical protein DCF68_16960 [Cyanothece sp. UBA12306]|nr:hypothetical protein [Cyanothece sp. UBA12306]
MPIDFKTIQEFIEKNLEKAPRDLCALECLANAPEYAKPDSKKIFLLWEAKKLDKITIKDITNGLDKEIEGIKIECIDNIKDKHPWLLSVFVPPEGEVVRFPFNTGDTTVGNSLSWITIRPKLVSDQPFNNPEQVQKFLLNFIENLDILPRWSTASRSCFALIPVNHGSLNSPEDNIKTEIKKVGNANFVTRIDSINDTEWENRNSDRFYTVVDNLGKACLDGVFLTFPRLKNQQYRLYSIKTGVDYVGSTNENKAGKNLLEANSAMAMLRSRVIESLLNQDKTFGVQTEVLTITAPTTIFNEKNPGEVIRDGFQVRDLSCLMSGVDYIPGQAIPYARQHFDELRPNQIDQQCDVWSKNFAYPLGRAKARLFLNYGLIHTSANAQNFLVGFLGTQAQQFVVRDVGDTSWHDHYIKQYLNYKDSRVFDAYDQERKSAIKHVLTETSSGDYPPPFMIRLAAYSLLTHGFAPTLIDKHKWNSSHLYKFTRSILVGLFDFIFTILSPKLPTETIEISEVEIQNLGTNGKYPTPKNALQNYPTVVKDLKKKDPDTLIKMAVSIRKKADDFFSKNTKVDLSNPNNEISLYINAEEICLCMYIEKLLLESPEGKTIQNIQERCIKGTWPPIFP